jgi:hypothetical protein
MWFLDPDHGLGINRRYYGGQEVGGYWTGAYWQHLTANTIQVYRNSDDKAADRVRVRVWIPMPAREHYESEWMDIAAAETVTISHGLGISATDLTVGLWFSGTARGIHHFAYGGLAVDGPQKMLGAHWQNLTAATVQVFRHADDTDVEQVRVAVVHGDPPHYDSGWQAVTQGTAVTFTHGLDWDPNQLLVRAECYDLSGQRGIHQMFAGGIYDWQGGGKMRGFGLFRLTDNHVRALRLDDDEFCSQLRVRIWRRVLRVYLPLVMRS